MPAPHSEESAERQCAREIAAQLIAECHPEEVDLFDDLVADHYAGQAQAGGGTAGHDDALGFGVAQMLESATPLALQIGGAVFAWFAGIVVVTAREPAESKIKAAIKDFLGVEPKTPEYTKEQLADLAGVFEKVCREAGSSRALAARMTDSVISRLALARRPS